ncbi:TIGR03619 family F420-dependent LLM class oxidoreductase [Sphaerimonospora thailandensis]|uniref:LLM class F420-dependent oxidoreductase n=1 Tax=Sphaerimonospora thailandensis TaxID=795644 RepID=A0A8J3RAI1_9ACTN|nr:TIGR03619 family F420-dependent LLM class oxidoreductase [Sphaerimonospora thailandensis]GIH72416.1 LLM class F420-dependent oxidoreductase [Sphaerimonospora thailandensis]
MRPLHIGLISPIVSRVPAVSCEWEDEAGIEELARIAETADRLGFHHLTCSEHIAVPTGGTTTRGAVFWDPLPTLGFLAARTRRLRLATQVVALGLHHPLAVAKRYGTLDRVSDGRLILGVGIGSIEEEFELLEVPFRSRAKRTNEAMRALRCSLGRREPQFTGEFFSYSDVIVEPHAVQEHVPMWVGGRSGASLDRALGLGDGWVPTDLGHEVVAGMLAEREVPDGFDVVLGTGLCDPIGQAARTVAAIEAASAAGATVVNVTIRSRSAGHYCEQVEALHALVADRLLVA